MEKYTFRELAVKDVAAEFPFLSRYRMSIDDLAASMDRWGMVCPVLIQDQKEPVLVAGHRRLEAAKRLGWDFVPAAVLPPSIAVKDIFLISLVSNWRQEWDEVDRLRGLKRARQDFGFSEDEICREILPLLGLVPEFHVWQIYRDCLDMPLSLWDQLAAGKLPFRGMVALSVLSVQDQCRFAVLLDRAALSASDIRLAAEWLRDLMRSERVGWETLFAREVWRWSVDSPLDRVQFGKRWMETLRLIRFPRLAQAETKFREKSRELNGRETRLRVEPPPSFEEEGFSIQARIRNAAELKAVIRELSKRENYLNSLFDIML